MTQLPHSSAARRLRTSLLLALVAASPARTQEIKPQASAEKSPELPAQIELLETHIRFESNGDSRKEVHTRIHINNELGARQFARLSFDYNRSFQQIEFPLVRVTHQGGGTADILPSAISDQPNPAVVNAPAYQDVRVKSVRILGLAPGDLLEYRVITTTSHHPLAPYEWTTHTFDRSGIVTQESFELDLPFSANITGQYGPLHVNPATPITSVDRSEVSGSGRFTYRWQFNNSSSAGARTSTSESPGPDIEYSSFGDSEALSIKLDEKLLLGAKPVENLESYETVRQEMSRVPLVTPRVRTKALALSKDAKTPKGRLESVYTFVSQKIATVDLPIGSTGFAIRPAEETLSSGYATPEDKFVLLSALAQALGFQSQAALTGFCDPNGVATPSLFTHLIVRVVSGKTNFWLDPSLEVAPFGVISPILNGCVFVLDRQFFLMNSTGHEWQTISPRLPFPSFQRVNVDAAIAADGTLAAKVKYSMRGDNELVLRLAFHQSPKEKWKEVAGLLALSDGFRGRITNVTASDPYATEKPFTVEYEISQPKFVDWSKKPVRIPALLPQLGLPDPPAKPAASAATSTGTATSAIELGTPLDVETRLTLHLPPGTSAHPPVGNAVVRDYATFASKYSAAANTVTASRHLNFLERQIPADRAPDYNVFVRAVHSDESQEFVLERSEPAAAQPATQNSKKKN